MIRHAPEIFKDIRKDGEIDAVVIKVEDTGTAGASYQIIHGLGRVPVGCIIQLKNKDCDVYKGNVWNNSTIEVKFTASNANINLRIW